MKQKLKLYLKFGILLFGISTLLINCQSDDNQNTDSSVSEIDNQKSASIVSAKEIPTVMDFIKSQTNEKMSFTLKPNVNYKTTSSRTAGTDPIELSISDLKNIQRITNRHGKSNYTFMLNNDKNDNRPHFLNLVVKEYRDIHYIMLIKYVPEQKWLNNPDNGFDTFTGDMIFYNANGEYVGENTMDSGTSTYSTLNDPCTDGSGSGSGSGGGGSTGDGTGDGGTGTGGDSGGSDGGSSGGGGGTYTCTWEVTKECINHEPGGYCEGMVTVITLDCVEDQLRIASTAYTAFSTTSDPCTLEPACYDNMGDPCPCNETYDDCLEDPNTVENPDIVVIDLAAYKTAFAIESKIVSINLDPCSDQILNELKNLGQTDIARIIYRFNAPSSTYDWEVKTATPLINSSNAAETDWKRDSNNQAIDYSYLTHLNPVYKNQATKIAIARTILHELIHTYLISLVDDATITGSSDVTSFPILWNALVNNTYDNNPNQLQHEIIGRKFIEPLRDALKEWDNAQQSDQYYEDLAWGALENTSTFNTLFPVGSNDRNRILNTNKAEDTNSSQGGTLPRGNSC